MKRKVRDIAAEHGVTPEDALELLRAMGEYVKSPASILMPQTALKLDAMLGGPLEHEAADEEPDAHADEYPEEWVDSREVTVHRRYLYRGAEGRYEALAPQAEGDVMIGHRDWTRTVTGLVRSWASGPRLVVEDEPGPEVLY